MDVCLMILSTDEAPLLRRSLPAAMAQNAAEVVVVDNASGDETAELAREHGARLLRLESRLSYCEAMNAAIAGTGGDALGLLQADCFVEPGFLGAARSALMDPTVGSVAPKLIRASGPGPGDGLGEIDTAGMVVDRRRKNGLVGHGRPGERYAAPAEVFGADGAAAVYRRATLEQCGGRDGEVFDPDLIRWASDADLAWRARVLGWRSVYAPGARARHIRTYSPSTRAAMSEESRRMQFRNRYLMMVKNDSWRELAPDLPRVMAYELLALGHALLRERFLLGAYGETLRLLPAARRRRRWIQAARRAPRAPFGLEAPE